MPVFKVLCRRDAFIDYVAEIEADDPKQAAERASEDHHEYEWRLEGEQEFDARAYVTLDESGHEIEATELSLG